MLANSKESFPTCLPIARSTTRVMARCSTARFIYDENTDAYRCPAGQTLQRKQVLFSHKKSVYRSSVEVCGEVPSQAAMYKHNAPLPPTSRL